MKTSRVLISSVAFSATVLLMSPMGKIVAQPASPSAPTETPSMPAGDAPATPAETPGAPGGTPAAPAETPSVPSSAPTAPAESPSIAPTTAPAEGPSGGGSMGSPSESSASPVSVKDVVAVCGHNGAAIVVASDAVPVGCRLSPVNTPPSGR